MQGSGGGWQNLVYILQATLLVVRAYLEPNCKPSYPPASVLLPDCLDPDILASALAHTFVFTITLPTSRQLWSTFTSDWPRSATWRCYIIQTAFGCTQECPTWDSDISYEGKPSARVGDSYLREIAKWGASGVFSMPCFLKSPTSGWEWGLQLSALLSVTWETPLTQQALLLGVSLTTGKNCVLLQYWLASTQTGGWRDKASKSCLN